jgi:hypothetical protein
MMDISPENKIITTFRPDELAEYVHLLGWAEAEISHGPWRVFTNDHRVPGEMLEIVVPRKIASVEGRMHLASSINLLSRLSQEDPEATIQRILYRNYDVLRVRNIETDDENTIELGMAADQVESLKSLVTYGACSEVTALPFFPRPQGKLYRPIVRHYRFGHTFRGSFGFTLSSRVEAPVVRFTQTRMFPDENDNQELVIAPPERRVMERIIRGLSFTGEAVRQQEPEQLAEQYPSGFNGNMCKAVFRMATERNRPIEYGVLWSPRVPPSTDIEEIETLQLGRSAFSSLETAYEMLRKTEPEYRPVKGLVTGLSSSDNPLGSESRRTVVILWTNKDISGPSKVIVALEPEDYQQALLAHGSWFVIEVTGLLQRFGNYWKLNNPQGFRIVG